MMKTVKPLLNGFTFRKESAHSVPLLNVSPEKALMLRNKLQGIIDLPSYFSKEMETIRQELPQFSFSSASVYLYFQS